MKNNWYPHLHFQKTETVYMELYITKSVNRLKVLDFKAAFLIENDEEYDWIIHNPCDVSHVLLCNNMSSAIVSTIIITRLNR